MITAEVLRELLRTKPFAPFRLHLSSGDAVEVWSHEVVLVLRQQAVVGKMEPGSSPESADGWSFVYYQHVVRVELLSSDEPTIVDNK